MVLTCKPLHSSSLFFGLGAPALPDANPRRQHGTQALLGKERATRTAACFIGHARGVGLGPITVFFSM